jgi:restriction system protein
MAHSQRRRKPSAPSLVLLIALGILALIQHPDRMIAALLLAGVAGAIFFVLRSSGERNKGRIPVAHVEDLDQILRLTPTQFEEYTRQLLVENGYKSMKVNGGAGDLGADLLGRDPDGRSIIVQCKRYAPSKKVGSREMQMFIGMQQIHHQAERGIYVTTSEFTPAARDLADNHGIWLINGSGLLQLRRRHTTGSRRGRSWLGGLAETFR